MCLSDCFFVSLKKRGQDPGVNIKYTWIELSKHLYPVHESSAEDPDNK